MLTVFSFFGAVRVAYLPEKAAASSMKILVKRVNKQNGNNRRDCTAFNPSIKLTANNYLSLYDVPSTVSTSVWPHIHIKIHLQPFVDIHKKSKEFI